MNSHKSAVPPPPILWVEIDHDVPRGHGIEFRHRDSGKTVVAFAVGYAWLHEPGAPVTVELLKNPPRNVSPEQWAEILDETKVAVVGFFNRSRKLAADFQGDVVSAWYNA